MAVMNNVNTKQNNAWSQSAVIGGGSAGNTPVSSMSGVVRSADQSNVSGMGGKGAGNSKVISAPRTVEPPAPVPAGIAAQAAAAGVGSTTQKTGTATSTTGRQFPLTPEQIRASNAKAIAEGRAVAVNPDGTPASTPLNPNSSASAAAQKAAVEAWSKKQPGIAAPTTPAVPASTVPATSTKTAESTTTKITPNPMTPTVQTAAPKQADIPQAQVGMTPEQLQALYNSRMAESEGRINDIYASQIAAQRQRLQTAYEQSLSDQQAAREQIGRSYQASANELATQYERNRRNLNMQAMANGLNTGTGSQQQLALNQQYMTNVGGLRGQEAQAYTAADRAIADLKTNYQNQISQAIADNDYQKAAALMDNYNQQQNWLTTQQNRYEDIALRQNERAQDQAIRQNERQEDWSRSQQERYEDQAFEAQRRYEELMQRLREREEDQAIDAANLERQYAVRAQERQQDIDQRNRERAEDQAIDAYNLNRQYAVRAQERQQDIDQRNRERGEDRQWNLEDQTYARQLEQAKIAASYGDFSAFSKMYGPETARIMKQTWAMQNPQIAWATDNITRDEYIWLTGQEPFHTWPQGGGGDSGGSSGGSSGGGFDWWKTVQGRQALGDTYSEAVANASNGALSVSDQGQLTYNG